MVLLVPTTGQTAAAAMFTLNVFETNGMVIRMEQWLPVPCWLMLLK